MSRFTGRPLNRFHAALDTLLDKSLVLGYTRVGPAVRRAWWPADPAPGALTGKHVIVTGAGSGLGRAAAEGLARLGATVHLVGRTEVRLAESAELIGAVVPGATLVVETCDLSDLDDVRRYAAHLRSTVPSLHAVVHNAGVLPPVRTESPQGHEATLATHVLGPVLLTEEVMDLLTAADDPRVVVVSSGGMYSAPLNSALADDLEYRHGDYDGVRAYARTKRVQVTMTELLAARYATAGVAVHCMHPGWAATPGVTESLPKFGTFMGPLLRDPAQGADTIVWLAGTPESQRPSGRFWCDRLVRPAYYLGWQSDDVDARHRVWAEVLDAVGLPAAR